MSEEIARIGFGYRYMQDITFLFATDYRFKLTDPVTCHPVDELEGHWTISQTF